MLQKAKVHFFFGGGGGGVDSLSAGLATHFSRSLYSIPYKCRKVNAGQTSHLIETMVKKTLPHLTVPTK